MFFSKTRFFINIWEKKSSSIKKRKEKKAICQTCRLGQPSYSSKPTNQVEPIKRKNKNKQITNLNSKSSQY